MVSQKPYTYYYHYIYAVVGIYSISIYAAEEGSAVHRVHGL